MASRLNDIRKRTKERHRKKKEEERRKQEEQRRAPASTQQVTATVKQNTDGYSRVYGQYGWQWVKVNNEEISPRAAVEPLKKFAGETRRPLGSDGGGGKNILPPSAMRALDQDFDGPPLISKTSEKNDDKWLTTDRSSGPGSGPVSFVSKTAAASPLSDVTCSQSPSKLNSKVSFAPTTEPIMNENDPVLVMERLEAQRKNKLAAAAKSTREDSTALQNNRGGGLVPSHPGPMAVSQRLSKQKITDPIEVARRKEEEEKRKMQQSDSEGEDEDEIRPTGEARNPIALERSTLGRRSLSPQARDLDNQYTGVRHQQASLWDDSEDEEGIKAATTKKAATALRKNGETAVRKEATKKKGGRKAASRPLDYDEYDGIVIDTEREEKLIPSFSKPKMGAPSALEPLKLPKGDNQKTAHEVPAPINRYLKAYQQQGVIFLYSCIMRGTGAILGDDMGMGKTVQIISLLASLFGKTGTGKDDTDLHRRRRLIAQKMRELKAARDEALLYGEVASPAADTVAVEGLCKSDWDPVLVIVPPSVIDNWKNEFKTWGHFSVGTYQGEGREQALEKVKDGTNEILICGKALAMSDSKKISKVQWKLIIVDEVHNYKNKDSKAYVKLTELRNSSQCLIIGMTGTIMPNRHEELWNLIDLVAPDHLGDWETFKALYSAPIKYARTKSASVETIQQSISCCGELDAKLKLVYIMRSKEEELADELPEKDEVVLFCEPTRIQKMLYQHILGLPDYELLRYANAPCDCGVNRAIFMGYKQLRTTKERIAYQRLHRDDIERRKKCCYKTPTNPNRDLEGEPWIHPDAVLWRSQHDDDEECDSCPFCIGFPAMKKLERLSSHAALLLAEQDPSSLEHGSAAWKEATKQVAFAKSAIPADILSELPGGEKNPYVRYDGVMNDHAKLSGKMEKLDTLLRVYDHGENRVLLFSHYTKTLDLIQQFVQSRGYTFVRLDGSTSTPDRQKLVDKFQTDPTIFLFLMSTKAGGLGLNLTAANKVIEFDLDFNPSHDEQAQDRAYRIGQKSDVQVVRLISQGTIEEQKYIRQIYKVHLKNDTIRDPKEAEQQARIFRGVEGDKHRKGEIFGIENLLKFKDGRFMSDLWKSSESLQSSSNKPVRVDDLKNSLAELSEEQIRDIGGNAFDADFDAAAGADEPEGEDGIAAVLAGQYAINHQDLFRANGGDAAHRESDDESDDDVLGGCSQNYLDVLARGAEEEEVDDGPTAPSDGAAAPPHTEDVRTEADVRPKKRRATTSAFAATLETVPESPTELQFAGAIHGFPEEQECIEASGRAPKRSKKNAPPPKAQEDTKTRFSSQDLFVPQYKKKKTKKARK